MNKKLAVYSKTGGHSHLVVDVEVNEGVDVLTVCGTIIEVGLMVEINHGQVSCERCRKTAARIKDAARRA